MNFKDAKQKEVDIFNHPKFQQAEAIKKLVSVCSDSLKKGFEFGSIGDDNTLILFFSHPAYTHEFCLKHDEIIPKMREIYKKERLAGVLYFKRVVAKNTPKYKPKITKSNQDNKYAEKSTGNFKIGCKNERLRSLFEDIQTIVKTGLENE